VNAPERSAHRNVALVLAGGGARGAYEVGALSVLLPVLQERDEYPDIMVGTSVGALNVAYFAATADQAAGDLRGVLKEAWRIWLGIRYEEVLRPLLSPRQIARFANDLGDFLGVPWTRFWSVFDPAPLARTVHDLGLIPRIRQNVEQQKLKVAAVVATAAYSGQSIVFHDGGADQMDPDLWRGVEYVKTNLSEEHVRASAAIPSAFPAEKVNLPPERSGWYFDGGTRLNTPIKPAIEFGADKVIVIALNSPRRVDHSLPRQKPDGYDGLTQVMQAVLVDPLVNDMKTLATVNETIREVEAGARDGSVDTNPKSDANQKRKQDEERRQIGYIFIAPEPDSIGACAQRVYRRHYEFPLKTGHSPSLSLLGHTLDAGKSVVRGELFSYLFFACEFSRELIKLGRRDAKAWLELKHDLGPWRTGPLPPPGGSLSDPPDC
jgi:NTE family protein